MTRRKVTDALHGREPDQELQWMIDLGASLTISARGYYPVEKQPGSLSHLMDFNELQHQVYGRICHFRSDKDWTLDTPRPLLQVFWLEGCLSAPAMLEVEGEYQLIV